MASGIAKHVLGGLSLVRESGRRFSRDRGALMAAGLAFYTLLSVAPLLMVGLAVVGHAFGTEQERTALARGLGETLGYEPTGTINSWLLHASHSPGIVSAIAIAVAVAMSTRLFAQIQSALNDIWGVPRRRPGRFRDRMKEFAQRRLVSFAMVAGAGILLLALIVARGYTHAIPLDTLEHVAWTRTTIDVVQTLLSIVVVALIAAVTYRILPDRDVPWRSAWAGATLSSLLFNLGIVLLGAYVGWLVRNQSFGPAGAFVFLLVWLYYSAQVFILGAEMTRVHARRRG